eukprot:4435784-Prymnesium_polylepis.1
MHTRMREHKSTPRACVCILRGHSDVGSFRVWEHPSPHGCAWSEDIRVDGWMGDRGVGRECVWGT